MSTQIIYLSNLKCTISFTTFDLHLKKSRSSGLRDQVGLDCVSLFVSFSLYILAITQSHKSHSRRQKKEVVKQLLRNFEYSELEMG